MATLLESRAHQHRVRLLSRKARESQVYEQDPPSRRLPVNPDHELTTRQRAQRRRREREKHVSMNSVDETANVCVSNIFAPWVAHQPTHLQGTCQMPSSLQWKRVRFTKSDSAATMQAQFASVCFTSFLEPLCIHLRFPIRPRHGNHYYHNPRTSLPNLCAAR